MVEEKLLIEENIEFELRDPCALVIEIVRKLGIFMTKQKSPKQIFK